MESYGLSLTSNAGVVSMYTSLAINSYGRVASAAFILYEYAITLDQEVEMFWKETVTKRKVTGATALFAINRYLVLFLRLLNLLGFVPMSDKKCGRMTKVALAFTLLQYVPWAAFAGLRAYALSRHKPMSAFIFTLSMATVALNLSLFPLGFTGYVDPLFGCTVIDPVSLDLSRKCKCSESSPATEQVIPTSNVPVVIICRTCFILADVLLIGITWFTISWRSMLDSVGRKDFLSLGEVLLRNGTTYFVALLFLHGLHLTLSLCSIHVALQGLSYGYVTVFAEVVEAALVSRFLLDLQVAHRQAMDMDSPSDQESGSVVFGRAVGSWGSVTVGMNGDQVLMVDQAQEVEDDDEDEEVC
ncbi:hypothetical protein GSI_12471 [Ganoderma sinense ZZ0214-1]|uniref:DUF6533 domain-containing protein n=1 Tax=Ganoderma sinense ZZ0214-1 TaxID=1077348 RepID=A0A2G8RSU8_9APHY|nr:hypothetical protein GSI_12471 [Ganoderma sinense ZZ0214-1]